MKKEISVVQYGLGPIGLETMRTVIDKEQSGKIKLVGAIDIDPEKVGKDIASLLGLEENTGIIVSADAAETLSSLKPDVVLHTTSSFLNKMWEQLALCAQHGAHVVSSTEELSFPYDREPEIASKLDEVAKANNVVILGTGVNPGYAMDTVALLATGVCTKVTGIQVERVVDAGQRRLPLQRKVGAGLSVEAFEEKKATGTFGHIGLRESLLMVADTLGWELDEIEETLNPMIASETIDTPYLSVQPDQVTGIHHAIRGSEKGKQLLSLDLKMYVGAENARDEVTVQGTPPINLVYKGGIFGDTATVATLINGIPLVYGCSAGLKTMRDVPVPRAFATK